MKQLHEQKVRIYLAGAGLIGLTAFLVIEALSFPEYGDLPLGSFAVVGALQAFPFFLYVALVRGRAVSWATGIVLLGISFYMEWWTAVSGDAQAGFAIVSGALLEMVLVLVVSALQQGTRLVKRLVVTFTNKQAS